MIRACTATCYGFLDPTCPKLVFFHFVLVLFSTLLHMEQNARQPMHATSLSDDHGEVKYKAATFSSIGVPLSEHPSTEQHNFATIGQQGHLLTPSPFPHPSSSIIRFAASDMSYQPPDSLETFDFNAIPSSDTTKAIPNDNQQQQQRQRTLTDESSSIQTSMNQPSSSHDIPHSSGMTTLSNMTSDDSTTLIGQGRSNTYHPSVSVATHPLPPPALPTDASRSNPRQPSRPSNPPLSSSPSPARPSTDGPGPSNSMIPMDTLTRGKTVDLAKSQL